MRAYDFSRTSRKVPLVSTEYRDIRTPIPAPGTEEMLARLDAVESRSAHGQLPIVWDGANDYSVLDIAGNEFIDFTSGIFVANIGHGNEVLRARLETALNIDPLHSYAYATEIRAIYLEKLTAWSGFEKAFLVSTGTEAVEAAVKLMHMHGMKHRRRRLGIICIEGAFHGRTLGAQLLGGDDAQRSWIGYDDPSIIRFPFPSQEILSARNEPPAVFFRSWLNVILQAKHLDPDLDFCGVMLETFQGWSAQFYPPEFVQEIEVFCRWHNLLLCFDEMQAGFARTGRKFGYEHYGVHPDLICVGKGMGGGLPLSGVLGRAEIMDLPDVGNMSSTHGGNPLCCAAGLAVIEEIERLDLVKQSEIRGLILDGRLHRHCGGPVKHIEAGRGLIAALIFETAEFASRVAERCMQKGLLVVHTGRESIKIGPPLTIPDAALIEGVSVLADAINEIEAESKQFMDFHAGHFIKRSA